MAKSALHHSRSANHSHPQYIRRTVVALAVAACFSTSVALANPTGGTVVHGTAQITNPAANILNINSLTAQTIINWGGFSIGVGELTRFIQPSALSAVLNRVTGQDPSAILGALQSNGRVFLINPNGITFGAGAQIDVAGLVASTLNLSNDDFLNNRLRFTDGAGAGSVVNQGSITGGSVYLVGKATTNDGLITSPNGEVVLAAGNSVELVNPGTPDLRVEIVAPDNAAMNLGTIAAEAGRIGIYAGLINNSGTLNASSAVAEGGRILLKSTRSTTLETTSVISARGTNGGRIEVLSDMATGTTKVAGILDVSAGRSGVGNGGFIETSAASVVIDDSTLVRGKGNNGGAPGLWLIDPTNFEITSVEAGVFETSLNTGSIDVIVSTVAAGLDAGDLLVSAPMTWNTSNNLWLIAHGDVTVGSAGAITNTANGGGARLYAGWDGVSTAAPAVAGATGSITLNAPISVTGDVHLVAGSGISQDSTSYIQANALLAKAGGSVSLNSAPNLVGTLAGEAGSEFNFSNNQPLIIGSVGGVSGVTVNAASGSATVGITVTTGSLTVNNNVSAAAGGFSDSASVTLTASGGGITVNSPAVVSARGGSGDWGGPASVTLTAGTGVEVKAGATVAAYGGAGSSGGSASINLGGATIVVDGAIAAYGGAGSSGGGQASVLLVASDSMTINGSVLAQGGNAVSGSGDGGGATIDLCTGIYVEGCSTPGPLTIGSSAALTATGGSGLDGGGGGGATINIYGGTISVGGAVAAYGGHALGTGSSQGANGGSATVNVAGSDITVTGTGSIAVTGGNGGDDTWFAGSGGSAWAGLMSNGPIVVEGAVTALGGNGGNAPDWVEWSVSGGTGGDATISLNGNSISVSTASGSLAVTGGNGGNGAFSGMGGNGGWAAAEMLAGTTVAVNTGAAVSAIGGNGGNGGGQASVRIDAPEGMTINGSLLAQGGNAASGSGDGAGSATIDLCAGTNVEGCSAAGPITIGSAGLVQATGGDAANGSSAGSADINMYGGTIAVGGAVAAYGGDALGTGSSYGGSGGWATVIVAGSGDITVTGTGSITVTGGIGGNGIGFSGSSGMGGGASVSLTGNTIVVDGAITAVGGAAGHGVGSSAQGGAGGTADITLGGVAGITVGSGASIAATGGRGGNGVGSSGSGGSGGTATVNVMSSSPIVVAGAMAAVGGAGGNGASGGSGGNATLDLNTSSFGTGSITVSGTGSIALTGGQGGTGGSYSGGSGGAAVMTLTSAETIGVMGAMTATGGTAGSGPVAGRSGDANVTLSAYGAGITVAHTIQASAAAGADGGDAVVGLYAYNSATVDTSGGTLRADGRTSVDSGSTQVDISAAGNVTLGQLISNNYVQVSSSGAIIDGNSGLNIIAPEAYLNGTGGVGSIANPVETQISILRAYASGGDIGIINSGDLSLKSAYTAVSAAGDVAIGSTGTLTVDGAEGSAGGDLSLLANGDINITGFWGSVSASGSLLLDAVGNITIGGPGSTNATAYGGSCATVGCSSTTAIAGGNLSVLSGNVSVVSPARLGSDSGSTTITTSGNVTVDESSIIGNPEITMTVGGVISMTGDLAYGGTIEAVAPTTIFVDFPNLTSGGYFVNGVESVVYDSGTATGFRADNSAAILDTNLFITYAALPPAPLPPSTDTPAPPTDSLIAAMGDSVTPPDPEKDKDIFEEMDDRKKKSAPICR